MNFTASPNSSPAPGEIDSGLFEQAGYGPKTYSIPLQRLRLVRPGAYTPGYGWSVSGGKRMMDIVGAAIALFLLLPALLFVALLVAFDSEGPVLFRQRRVGKLGELFTIYKFRTMYVGPPHCGPGVTQCGDARVTQVGRVLRRFKLDEMPQFYNVLRGDMSLVGPRPKLAHHEGMHMVFRPGITGAATLAFRSEEEMLRHIPQDDLEFYYARTIKPLKARMDLQYMEGATMLSDLCMLLRTAASCALPRRYHPVLRLQSPDLGSFDLETLDISVGDAY